MLHPPPPFANRAATSPGVLCAPFRHRANFSCLEDIERVENSGGIGASLSGRYATALFQLARDEKTIDAVEASLNTLRAALDESADFKTLTTSPILSRADAEKGVEAVAGPLGLDPITTRFLGVLAQNRRLGQLSMVIRDFRILAARHRGETTAEVTSAHPLDDSQVSALKTQLKSRLGRDVAVELNVDPQILGGLVVRVGSQMIDSSIRTRLNSLAHAMKG
jgi:F-type H+-transporting ATPase subunit delta